MRAPADLVKIRDSVAMVGRLSDNLAHIGPFRIGLDGVLSWIPGVGEIYSACAAGFILGQAVRARVPIHVLLGCAALMAARTGVSVAPLAGPLVADVFLAHRWSARMVVRAIDKKLGALPPPNSAAGELEGLGALR